MSIASFVILVIVFIVILLIIDCAEYLEFVTDGGVEEKSVEAKLAGLVIIVCFFVDFVGLALGIVGIVQKNHLKLFAVLGFLFQ